MQSYMYLSRPPDRSQITTLRKGAGQLRADSCSGLSELTAMADTVTAATILDVDKEISRCESSADDFRGPGEDLSEPLRFQLQVTAANSEHLNLAETTASHDRMTDKPPEITTVDPEPSDFFMPKNGKRNSEDMISDFTDSLKTATNIEELGENNFFEEGDEKQDENTRARRRSSRLSFGELNEHLPANPSPWKKYICPHCEKCFGRKYDLKRHIDRFHDGLHLDNAHEEIPTNAVEETEMSMLETSVAMKRHVCEQCPESFHSIVDLHCHVYSKHESHDSRNDISVETTPKTTARPQSLEGSDIKVTHDCPHCPLSYGRRSHLLRHIRRKHSSEQQVMKPEDPERHFCPSCDTSYTRRSDLSRHIQRRHKQSKISNAQKLEPFACRFCSSVYQRMVDLQRHVLIKHPGKKKPLGGDAQHRCPHCDLSYGRRNHLRRHVRQKHTNNISTELQQCCPHCKLSFSSRDILYRHIREKHSSKAKTMLKYCCPYCEASYGRRDNMRRHVRLKHSSKASATLSKSTKLKSGTSAVLRDSKRNYCSHCPASFARISDLNRHIRIKHTRKRASKLILPSSRKTSVGKGHTSTALQHCCPHCGSSFERIDFFFRHIRQEHPTEAKATLSHCCPHCEASYGRRDHLRRHIRRKHASKANATLQMLSKAAQLSKQSTLPRDPKRSYCPHCQTSYSRQTDLNHHIRVKHTKERSSKLGLSRPVKTTIKENDTKLKSQQSAVLQDPNRNYCSFCPTSFSRLSDLNRHLRMKHTKEVASKLSRPVGISTLTGNDKKLKSQQSAVHGDAKRNYCSYCPTSFSRLSDLNRHLRIKHTRDTYKVGFSRPVSMSSPTRKNEKPSDVSFDDPTALSGKNTHATAITNPKRHNCSYCTSSFGRRFDCHRHMRLKHGHRGFNNPTTKDDQERSKQSTSRGESVPKKKKRAASSLLKVKFCRFRRNDANRAGRKETIARYFKKRVNAEPQHEQHLSMTGAAVNDNPWTSMNAERIVSRLSRSKDRFEVANAAEPQDEPVDEPLRISGCIPNMFNKDVDISIIDEVAAESVKIPLASPNVSAISPVREPSPETATGRVLPEDPCTENLGPNLRSPYNFHENITDDCEVKRNDNTSGVLVAEDPGVLLTSDGCATETREPSPKPSRDSFEQVRQKDSFPDNEIKAELSDASEGEIDYWGNTASEGEIDFWGNTANIAFKTPTVDAGPGDLGSCLEGVEPASDVALSSGNIGSGNSSVIKEEMNSVEVSHGDRFEDSFEESVKVNCVICDAQFDCSEELVDHLSKQHPMSVDSAADIQVSRPELKENQYFCSMCEKVCHTKEHFIEHIKIEHFLQNLSTLSPERTKVNHGSNTRTFFKIIGVHGKTRTFCRLDKSHNLPYLCTQCSYRTRALCSIRKHIQNHLGVLPFSCKLCGKSFRTRTRLKYHTHKHTEKRLPCVICGAVFGSQFHLLLHMKRHLNKKSFFCDKCGKPFTTRSNLRQHIQKWHDTTTHGMCEFCGEEFTAVRALKAHILRLHTDPADRNTHACDECGKTFAFNHRLREHQRLHNPQVICDECGAAYADKHRLESHKLRMHRRHKAFCCSACGQQFYTKQELQTHELSHTGERPHKCSHCHKAFARSDYLRKHELIHTGKKPHQCKICNKEFSRKSNLNVHLKWHEKVGQVAEIDMSMEVVDS